MTNKRYDRKKYIYLYLVILFLYFYFLVVYKAVNLQLHFLAGCVDIMDYMSG
jgi:hypothetical protein